MTVIVSPLKEKAIIIQIEFGYNNKRSSVKNALEEFSELVESSGALISETILGKQDKPVANHYIKKGRLEEIKTIVSLKEADLVIFNHDLSPSQERNLEKILCVRVLDRTGLILDIFASRAQSYTGKLQVELAQLNHLSTRLVRGWSHLERQKGGIGLRGPGETQLETDRRLINQRVRSIKKKMLKVHSQRRISRYSRAKGNVKLVSILGYTNVGKTTLFNLITGDEQLAKDQLFATLDSVTRKGGNKRLEGLLFSDTVGFISDLPTELIESFKATLDELRSADLLLHIVDISDPNYKFKMLEVDRLILDLGLKEIDQIIVFNKTDLLDVKGLSSVSRPEKKKVWISAEKKIGISALEDSINYSIYGSTKIVWISLKPGHGKIRANLFSHGRVIEERIERSGLIQLKVELGAHELSKLISLSGVDLFEKDPILLTAHKVI